ncbi:MAG: DUF2341 domain-containing protein [Candidatus Lokiarchaeota archaeon]|nr:DUF2341 domain-containing protein [Candidatus Lokiarchaeota archaeon]
MGVFNKKFKNRAKTLLILTFAILFPLVLNLPLQNSSIGKETVFNIERDNPYLSSNGLSNANYFSFYKNITIDQTKVSGSGSHTDFPFLLSFIDSDLHGNVQLDGDDIAFAIDNSWLDHEIELFNPTYSTTEVQLIAWIRIPSLSTSVDTVISMYYGNSTMISRQNPEGVWDIHYEAVYHLHDDFLDSTPYNRDGTNSGSVDIAGRIGDGQDFERSDNYDNINIGTWSIAGTEITIQAWVKLESFSVGDARILSKNSGLSDDTEHHVWMLGTEISPNRLRGRIKTGISDFSGTSTVVATSGDLSIATWYLTTLIYDGSNIRFVLDGTPVGAFSKSGSLRVNDWPITIGNNPTEDKALDAIIDEVRISSTVRSNDWLLTEYNNQNDPDTFYSIGVEQQVSTQPSNADYFNYYKVITIDHTQVSGTDSHINFPLLISLLDEDLHDDVQITGNDIAFSTNGKWLDHQIELFDQTYNGTHAQLFAWVRVPFLLTTEDTNVTMYYGNSTMSSRQNPNGVWDANYVGVWHLNDDPTSTIYDSTSPNSNGASSGLMTSSDLVSGIVGKALDFDGNNDYVYFTNSPELQITGEITVQAWFKANYFENDYLFNKMDGVGNRGWEIRFFPTDTAHGRVSFRYSPDGINIISSGDEDVEIGNWYHVVGVFKPSTYNKFFLDGTLVETGTMGIPPSLNDPPYNVLIAEKSDGSGNYDGIIDECRISNIARSDGWIITEYNNQYNPDLFYSVGSEKDAKETIYLEAQINAIDLYSNLIPNANVSLIKNDELITSDITNSNGSVRFTNIIKGEYNFTVSITSNIENLTELVNVTSQPILIDKGFQMINLTCNVSMNFFEIFDVDGLPVESGWIVVENSSNLLQNCTIDSTGKTTFYWVNISSYEYNYTVYYQNMNYFDNTIELSSGNITSPNSLIQVQTELTTVEFTILVVGTGDPVGGAKLKLKVNNTFGDSIVNLTTDFNGKATLRWLNSSGINGNYSLEIEFFGQNRMFNITIDGPGAVDNINFSIISKDSKEFRIAINLDDFQTELSSLNPIDYIQVTWGTQLKLRVLFNITKAEGLPTDILGPAYADWVTFQLLLGGNPVLSVQMCKEINYIGRHCAIIDTTLIDSDVTYIIKVSAQKSGFTLPSDLYLQLDVLKNDLVLNQSENNDTPLSVFWSDSVNMSLSSYGKNIESFTLEDMIFQNSNHEFSFSIPEIYTNWNLSHVVFNIYNINWNTDIANINITIEDPYGNFYMYHKDNHSGWDFIQGSWTGISLLLDMMSPTDDNNFDFIIGGSYNDPIDIIAEVYFIRNTEDVELTKFNQTDSISIQTEIEGWVIKNVVFEISDCYETSTWTTANLSTLTNLNITTNEGFKYSLASGYENGTGFLTIDDRKIYPLGNQFSFAVEGYTNLSFNVNIKIEYVQEFYRNQYVETYNSTITMQDVSNGGIFPVTPLENGWDDNNAYLSIKSINNGVSYFYPTDISMQIIIGGNIYIISDISLGVGFFSLESFTKNEILNADINTDIPVNFTLFVIIENSKTVYYKTVGTLNYVIRETPSVFGVVPYDSNLECYLQYIDTSIIDADEYTIRFTFLKDHFETATKDLELNVQQRLTLINGDTEFYRSIENVYVKDGVNFTFIYTDALTGDKISNLKTQFFIWEKYSNNGTVMENDQGTIITSKNNTYILDFDTETRLVGEYLLIATLDKENYEYKNAMILLSINKREIDYTLCDNFRNKQASVVQGNSIPIMINLTDPTKGDIPLINATISLTIGGVDYEFEKFENGTYRFDFQTVNINAFFTSTTLRAIINISREDYISEEFSIIIVVEMQEIFPGIPTFYFLVILSIIIAVTGSLVGYRVYKYAKIPEFVKKARAMKKAIEGDKSISESLLYQSKNSFIGERIRDKWEDIGLSVENVLGIKSTKEMKGSKIERRISGTVERRNIQPIGLVFMKWDERIGTEILAKYPEETTVSEKTLMQIYSTHEYSGEKGIITLTSGLLNIISYYTGPEMGFYLVLLLNIDDDPDMYEGGMADILRVLLDNVEDDSYIQMMPSFFQRLSVYPSLSDEEILSLNYQDEIKRMIIENLRDVGAISKSELMIWLRDKYVEGFIDIEATLLELLKRDIVKQVSVKGFPSELIFLTNDFFMLRVPPNKLFKDPANKGLPTQFLKEYREEITRFFQNYQPTSEDNLKIISLLINPQAYETIRLLRTSIVTLQDLEKLKKKGVDDAPSIIRSLWDNKMVKVFRDENDIEYYALLSDFYMDLIFPKYLLSVIKTAYEQRSQPNRVLIEYLKSLEDTYFDLKSEDKV